MSRPSAKELLALENALEEARLRALARGRTETASLYEAGVRALRRLQARTERTRLAPSRESSLPQPRLQIVKTPDTQP